MKRKTKRISSPGGLEPPTFRLTAERANRLRHGDHLTDDGEILNFKSNDLFHYVIVPISFPDSLLFTFSSFPIFFYFSVSFHLLQNCTNMLFSHTGFGKTQNLLTGILTGFDCYLCQPGNGIHPNLDTGCRIFFPCLLGNRDGSNVRCTLQSKQHSELVDIFRN